MHEMAFAEQVLTHVLHEAAAYPDMRVSRVVLRAGEPLAIEPASLRFCLEAIAAGTPMDRAAIEYTETGDLGPELVIQEIELDEQDGEA
jgi:hydrogenase nickel incorporation protein HypA/HybF